MIKTEKVGFFACSSLLACFAEAFWATPLLDSVSMAHFQSMWVVPTTCSVGKLSMVLQII